MKKNFSEIFERIKKYLRAHSDSEVAKGLEITPQALSMFKKQNKFPSELLIKFCLKNHMSIDWLIIGEGEISQNDEEKFILKITEGNPEISKIIKYLKENPDDAKFILKILNAKKTIEYGKKDIKEAIEGLQILGLQPLIERM